MKILNADDLKKEISKAPVWTALSVKEMIDEMSTDLVRCKECKYYDDGWCNFNDSGFDDDGYCSYGEREGE